jgi:putative endonuclease
MMKENIIGSTNNLYRRLKEHKQGKTRTTRIFNINTIIYSEKFDTISEARTRERKLKSYKSKKYIDWLIQKGR